MDRPFNGRYSALLSILPSSQGIMPLHQEQRNGKLRYLCLCLGALETMSLLCTSLQ
ncbi:unnamed protein product, partial [Vitis vinifera]|uniref:Uncharacterized protein n=1 Tax=Vitis vinifera TaxID=29760 RepID=D7T7E7_VITVI